MCDLRLKFKYYQKLYWLKLLKTFVNAENKTCLYFPLFFNVQFTYLLPMSSDFWAEGKHGMP